VVRLAGAAIGRLDLSTLGLPVCQGLADSLGETINIAVLDGSVAVNITQARGAAAISAQNWIGQRTPLHATSSGKVLLAHLEPARRKEIVNGPLIHFTPNTLTDPAALTQELDEVSATGYATTFEELEIGLHAVAVPIFGSGGRLLAAMSASGPAYRLPRRQTKAIAADLAVGAAALSGQLQLLA
jgi:DNA-binding IclR family transcriptional regulator